MFAASAAFFAQKYIARNVYLSTGRHPVLKVSYFDQTGTHHKFHRDASPTL